MCGIPQTGCSIRYRYRFYICLYGRVLYKLNDKYHEWCSVREFVVVFVIESSITYANEFKKLPAYEICVMQFRWPFLVRFQLGQAVYASRLLGLKVIGLNFPLQGYRLGLLPHVGRKRDIKQQNQFSRIAG